MLNLDASYLLARLQRVDVSPDLLRDIAHAYAKAVTGGSGEPLATVISGCIAARNITQNRADLALAAKIRILSLACLVGAHLLDEWVQEETPNGIVLFHSSLFRAAATEPLVFFPNDNIGFDPASLRRRVLELASVHGYA